MSMVWEGMCCPLCNLPIDIDAKDFIAFPYVGLENTRYAALDDAAVHNICIKDWMKRDQFIRLFNEAMANSPNPLPGRLEVIRNGEVSWVN